MTAPTPTATNSSETADLFAPLMQILPDIGLGGILGYATGLAVQKIGRFVLIGVGILFVCIQLLAHWEIVSVDWTRLQVLSETWFREQGEASSEWLSRTLTAQLPFAGTFAAGFWLGFKSR